MLNCLQQIQLKFKPTWRSCCITVIGERMLYALLVCHLQTRPFMKGKGKICHSNR